ncbi:MAG: serpin family protein [Gemmatimonadota bacterium]
MQTNQILLGALVLALAGCSEAAREPISPGPVLPNDTARALTVQEQQVVAASNRFAFELLRDIDRAESDKPNLMVSPLSVSMALGMTLNGAVGSTFDAMRSTLAFGDLSQHAINAAYRGLIGQLRARDPQVEWGLANSIWYDNAFTAYPTFIDTVRHYFAAEVQQLDFASAAAPKTISTWAEQRTGGRIKNLIDRISPDEVMFLVNAVYFKAPWTRPFEPNATRDMPFRRADGSTANVKMMMVDGAFRHSMSGGRKAVELLYADSAYSMVLWTGSIPSDTEWNALLTGMTNGRVILRLPKFKFDYETELKPLLSDMGMAIAFTPFQANFTRIANRDDLYLTRVTHKSFIDVHELGTEAAAATAVGVGVTSMPPELTFDEPFYFAIRERSTGVVLFAGRVRLP